MPQPESPQTRAGSLPARLPCLALLWPMATSPAVPAQTAALRRYTMDTTLSTTENLRRAIARGDTARSLRVPDMLERQTKRQGR